MDKELADKLRKTIPEQIAKELLSVQPLDLDLFRKVYEGGMSEEELIAQGYEPVSHCRLLWMKKEQKLK